RVAPCIRRETAQPWFASWRSWSSRNSRIRRQCKCGTEAEAPREGSVRAGCARRTVDPAIPRHSLSPSFGRSLRDLLRIVEAGRAPVSNAGAALPRLPPNAPCVAMRPSQEARRDGARPTDRSRAGCGPSRLWRGAAALNLRTGPDGQINPRLRVTGLLGLAGAGVRIRSGTVVLAGRVDAVALLGLKARRRSRVGLGRNREAGHGRNCRRDEDCPGRVHLSPVCWCGSLKLCARPDLV